jgi:hypothetical protein
LPLFDLRVICQQQQETAELTLCPTYLPPLGEIPAFTAFGHWLSPLSQVPYTPSLSGWLPAWGMPPFKPVRQSVNLLNYQDKVKWLNLFTA